MEKTYNPQDWRKLVKELHEISKEKEITQMNIADKTGLQQSAISSFFSLRFQPKIDTLLKISGAIGVNLSIDQKGM